MSDLAQIDYLTGLANRRGIYDYYYSLRENQAIHAMYIDVDNFKRVNDLYGHSVGDELLVAIAKMLNQNVDGFTARMGGDEFVALLDSSLTEEDIIKMSEKLLSGMETLECRADVLSCISLSIGIVFSQICSLALDDILHKCDIAMYQAKYDGKNRFALYHDSDEQVIQNKNIELEMEDALINGEFVVFLQPKVNLITSGLVGAEALSRWNHPMDGIRLPDKYISIFEKKGFISKLDFYILEETCKIKKSWVGMKQEHIVVSVNMSRIHFYDPDFVKKLVDITDRYGVAHEEIEIEITESVFVKDNQDIIENVRQIKEAGFPVSIDDFGSGFSSLNLLKDMPADTVKIDKEFLRDSTNNEKGKRVLRNVISMCRDLKMDVVMEGIETLDQVKFVSRFGCQIGQGFYYSKPVSVDDFNKFADEYLLNIQDKYEFRFNGSLISEDQEMQGEISGTGLSYVPGIFKDSQAIRFPGGETETNVVELPPHAIVNDSYTISLWVKPEKLHLWGCACYVKFETGFSAMLPLAWEGHSCFRIRDSREVNGWYDVSGHYLQENLWWHYCVSYNARTETAIACINGEIVSVVENIMANRFVKRIMIGGDVFQPSFVGSIGEIVIYNEAKDYTFLQELYNRYISDPNFVGFSDTKDEEC